MRKVNLNVAYLDRVIYIPDHGNRKKRRHSKRNPYFPHTPTSQKQDQNSLLVVLF